MQDKGVRGLCGSLRSHSCSWGCVDLAGNSRARSSAGIAAELTEHGFRAVDAGTPENGLALAEQMNSDFGQQIVILGSFYLVAAIKEVLQPS